VSYVYVAPVPLRETREAVDDDDAVDNHVCHGAPEAEPRDTPQTAQQGTRQQDAATDQDPSRQVERCRRKHADHQFPAQQDVENTRHQQLDQLGQEHQSTANSWAPRKINATWRISSWLLANIWSYLFFAEPKISVND